MSERECCPTGYLMQTDETLPGLIDSLKGVGGERWRLFVTIGLCILVVLVITGVRVALGNLR